MIFAGLAFWFIRYQYDQNAKERTVYIERDEANDKRAFELAQNCNEAMSKLAQAVEMNTKAIEQNGRAVTEMVKPTKGKGDSVRINLACKTSWLLLRCSKYKEKDVNKT